MLKQINFIMSIMCFMVAVIFYLSGEQKYVSILCILATHNYVTYVSIGGV